jgi:hypothetical protein
MCKFLRNSAGIGDWHEADLIVANIEVVVFLGQLEWELVMI